MTQQNNSKSNGTIKAMSMVALIFMCIRALNWFVTYSYNYRYDIYSLKFITPTPIGIIYMLLWIAPFVTWCIHTFTSQGKGNAKVPLIVTL